MNNSPFISYICMSSILLCMYLAHILYILLFELYVLLKRQYILLSCLYQLQISDLRGKSSGCSHYWVRLSLYKCPFDTILIV